MSIKRPFGVIPARVPSSAPGRQPHLTLGSCVFPSTPRLLRRSGPQHGRYL